MVDIIKIIILKERKIMIKSKKFLISIISLFAMFVLVISSAPIASAKETTEECDQEFTYTESRDSDKTQVNINFQDDHESITVTAKNGYVLVSVELDVDNDDHGGFYTYPVVSGVKYNPNPGDEIDSARVVVKKVCDICPNIKGVQTTIPKNMKINSKGDCVRDYVSFSQPETPKQVLSATTEPLPTGGGNGSELSVSLLIALAALFVSAFIFEVRSARFDA